MLAPNLQSTLPTPSFAILLIPVRTKTALRQRAGPRRLRRTKRSKSQRAGILSSLNLSRKHPTMRRLTGDSCGAIRNRNGPPEAAALCSSATRRTLSFRPRSAAAPWQWKMHTRLLHACRSAAKETFLSPPKCTTGCGTYPFSRTQFTSIAQERR